MTARFSEEAWDRTKTLRDKISRLPFNTELAAGALAPARFRFYITQDALYLAEYARVLALAAAKAPDAATVRWFSQAAGEAIAVEQALHASYLAKFGVDPAAVARAEPSPDCLAYTSYLLATAHQQPWEVTVAAILPCFWLYWDVAGAIVSAAAPDNPYRAWIDAYADPRFGEAVRAAIAIADRAADAATPEIRNAGDPQRDARRLHPLGAIRIPVLGRRLPQARLARLRHSRAWGLTIHTWRRVTLSQLGKIP